MPTGLDVGKSSQWSCRRQRCTLPDATCSEVRAMRFFFGLRGLCHVLHHEYGCMLVLKWLCEVAVCLLATTARSFGDRKHKNALSAVMSEMTTTPCHSIFEDKQPQCFITCMITPTGSTKLAAELRLACGDSSQRLWGSLWLYGSH